MSQRIYIDVIAWHKPDGTVSPVKIKIGEHAYCVSSIADVRQAASRKAGGEGIRHTCLVMVPIDGDGHVREAAIMVFHSEDKWFIESDQADTIIGMEYSA